MVITCNEFFLSDKLCQHKVEVQSFRDCLCFHNQEVMGSINIELLVTHLVAMKTEDT
jgi:hypothetical protein